MKYTEINARRDMAKRLFEVNPLAHPLIGGSWHLLHPEIKRMYEAQVEKFLDPRNEEVRDALRAIGFTVVGP